MRRQLRLSWNELNNGASVAGEGAFNLLRQIAESARTQACSIYSKAPGAIIPNPANSFLRGFWNEMCSPVDPGDPPLPSSPAPPFTGGQCPGIIYDVTVDVYRNTGALQVTKTISSRPGEIVGCRTRLYTQIYENDSGEILLIHSGGSFETRVESGTAYGWDYDNGVLQSTSTGRGEIISVVRSDGLADDCGDPPSDFPPPQDYSSDVTNIINIKDETNNFSLPLTLTWVDADFDQSIKPVIEVGGIQVSFDLGGVTFDFDDSEAPVPLPDSDPVPPWNFPLPEPTEPTDLPSCPDPCPTPMLTGAKQFLRVTADISNYYGDHVFADNNGDEVIFGGYVRWTIGGTPYGSEEKVRRLIQHFIPPYWADGYVLNAMNGVLLTANWVEQQVALPLVAWTTPPPEA